MRETELAEKFITHFSSGYEIFKEVPGHGIIDIVAYRNPITIAIECKMQFSFNVIEQAFRNIFYANYSYVGIPARKGYALGFAGEVCNKIGVGVLTYREHEGVTELLKPRFNRRVVKLKLRDYMKDSIAGSQNDRVTAFKNTINIITKHLQRNNGICPIKKCLSEVDHHYRSIHSAKSSIYKMVSEGIIKDFTVDGKGNFILTQQPND